MFLKKNNYYLVKILKKVFRVKQYSDQILNINYLLSYDVFEGG